VEFSSDSPGTVKTCSPSPEVSENLDLLSGTRGVTDQKKNNCFYRDSDPRFCPVGQTQ